MSAEAQRAKGRRGRYSNAEMNRGDSLKGFVNPADSSRAVGAMRGSAASDTLAADTTQRKEAIDAPVIYEASDSIVFTKGGLAHLYGSGKVNYQNIELTSGIITMNMDSSTVYARGIVDTAGVETAVRCLRTEILRTNLRRCAITSSRRKVSSIISLLSRAKDM